jgi:hypothetical protein
MSEQSGDIEDVLRAIEDQHSESTRVKEFQENFEKAKGECLLELSRIEAGAFEMTAEDHEKAIRDLVTHYFDALLTPQQIELKSAILENAKTRDEATAHILSNLLENYG